MSTTGGHKQGLGSGDERKKLQAQTRSWNGVSWWTGGVGRDEGQAIVYLFVFSGGIELLFLVPQWVGGPRKSISIASAGLG